MLGNSIAKDTPLPIPNREVKLSLVDGTAGFLCGRVDYCRAFFL